jgi:predicted aminopeptidase
MSTACTSVEMAHLSAVNVDGDGIPVVLVLWFSSNQGDYANLETRVRVMEGCPNARESGVIERLADHVQVLWTDC